MAALLDSSSHKQGNGGNSYFSKEDQLLAIGQYLYTSPAASIDEKFCTAVTSKFGLLGSGLGLE
jgi:hypothetical protein